MKTVVSILAATAALSVASTASAQQYYKMSTIDPAGGTPYVVTAFFSQTATKHVPNVEVQLNATGSAAQHMLDLAKNNIDFSMTSSLMADAMRRQAAMYAKVEDAKDLYKNLRGIFAFSTGPFHVVVYDDSGMKSLMDIKGKTVFLGPPSGGATVFAQGLVEGATGYKAGEDFKLARMGFAAASQAFADRKIDVWMHPALIPASGIQQVALTNKIRILGLSEADFEKEGVKKAMNLPGRIKVSIPAGSYGANQANTDTVWSGASIIGVGTRKDIPEDVVYRATKAFWENIGELHAQGAELKNINLNTALVQVQMPLHPGALKYYKEKGLTIPAELMP